MGFRSRDTNSYFANEWIRSTEECATERVQGQTHFWGVSFQQRGHKAVVRSMDRIIS